MIIKGNRLRAKIVTFSGMALIFLTALLLFYLIINKYNNYLVMVFLPLEFFIILFTAFFMIRANTAAILKLDNDFLSIQAGLRPILVEWSQIKDIDIFKYMNRSYLGIKLNNLDTLKKVFRSLAVMNDEKTGYHFCFAAPLFESSLEEVRDSIKAFRCERIFDK